MRGKGTFIGSLLFGAGIMYLLDPDRGSRRRAGVVAAARDFRNRSSGAAAELKARFRRDPVGDEIIEERVRRELGRVVERPRLVSVTVYEGRVILSGRVSGDEIDELLETVRGVRGVREVENQLEVGSARDHV